MPKPGFVERGHHPRHGPLDDVCAGALYRRIDRGALAALPFGLLAVGAALKPEVIRGHIKPIMIASIVQFGLKPLLVALLIAEIGLSGVAAGVLIIAFIVPTAPSAYILARQLGGDTEAMASIITFQTLLAFLLMPLLASLMLA